MRITSFIFSQFLRMHIPILTGNQNGSITCYKNGRILIKNVLFKFNFQNEGHLDANFLIYILTINRECLLFQLFIRGIRMHISILTGVQIGYISGKEISLNFLKSVLYKVNFQDERYLCASCFFYILNIYHKCLLFQFLGCGIRMQIPILTGVRKGHISF